MADMIDTDFTAGVFKNFRVLTKIHLGALGRDLDKGTMISFDGTVLRHGTQDHTFPALRGAIKVGWVVPDSSTASEYIPRPAGIQVGAAVSRGETRDLHASRVEVSADEQDAGTIPRKIQVSATTAPKKGDVSSDGVIVGKLKTPAKFTSVEIGTDDRQIVSELDSNSRLVFERTPSAIAGDLLTDLLPDAADVGRPVSGVAGEGRGNEADARASGRLAPVLAPVFDARAECHALAKQIDVMQDNIRRILRELAKINSRQEQTLKSPVPAIGDPNNLLMNASVEQVEQVEQDDGEAWDMKPHWKARIKNALDLYGDDPEKLGRIMKMEMASVRSGIEQGMARRNSAHANGAGNGNSVIENPLHL